jgi:hypothetical protein
LSGGFSLPFLGVEVRGRSCALQANRPNTNSIWLAASAFIAGEQFDDLENELDERPPAQQPYPLRDGIPPRVRHLDISTRPGVAGLRSSRETSRPAPIPAAAQCSLPPTPLPPAGRMRWRASGVPAVGWRPWRPRWQAILRPNTPSPIGGVQATSTPNDRYFEDQWGLFNAG